MKIDQGIRLGFVAFIAVVASIGAFKVAPQAQTTNESAVKSKCADKGSQKDRDRCQDSWLELQEGAIKGWQKGLEDVTKRVENLERTVHALEARQGSLEKTLQELSTSFSRREQLPVKACAFYDTAHDKRVFMVPMRSNSTLADCQKLRQNTPADHGGIIPIPYPKDGNIDVRGLCLFHDGRISVWPGEGNILNNCGW